MEKYAEIIKIIKKEYSNDSSHTIDHVFRVYKNALSISKSISEVNLKILETSVLLHDIARVIEDQDNTGEIDHACLGAKMAGEILLNFDYSNDEILQIKHCIECHRYRGNNIPSTIEAKILFDADKLDLLGAIGIARSFIIAGEQHQKIYSTQLLTDYVKENLVNGALSGRIIDISKHTVFYEYQTKIKFIPNKLFTEVAKKIAFDRINFMEIFFKQLENAIINS